MLATCGGWEFLENSSTYWYDYMYVCVLYIIIIINSGIFLGIVKFIHMKLPNWLIKLLHVDLNLCKELEIIDMFWNFEGSLILLVFTGVLIVYLFIMCNLNEIFWWLLFTFYFITHIVISLFLKYFVVANS